MWFQQIPQAADSAGVVSESLDSSLVRIGEGVTSTGRLILSGDWDQVTERMIGGTTDMLASWFPSLVSAVIVGIFFFGVYLVLARIVHGVLRRSSRVDAGLEAIAFKTFRIVGWGFIVLLVLSQLGVNVSALIAGLGIAGLAVGFAAKDSLENFISGLTILLDRPFVVGNWVTVGGHFGRVTSITLRSTRLRTLNEETVVFPSVSMVNQPLLNHSAGSPLRVDVPFGIAYKEDIDEARAAVMGVLEADDERLAPGLGHRVVTTGLNDSSVDLELHVFVRDPANAVGLRFELTEKIRKALARADIEIPFPHLQLFIDGADAWREQPLRLAVQGRN